MKADDRGHAQEMHQPDILEAAEQVRELGELHGLPQRQAGNHDHDADQHDAEIENFLHGIVVSEIIMTQAKAQRIADGAQDFADRNRETACDESGRSRFRK